MSRTFHHAPFAVQRARAEGRKYNKTHEVKEWYTQSTTRLYFYAHERPVCDELIKELEARDIEYSLKEVDGFAREVVEAEIELDGDLYRTVSYTPVNVVTVPGWVNQELYAKLPLHRNGVSDTPKRDFDKRNIFYVLEFTEEHTRRRETPAG